MKKMPNQPPQRNAGSRPSSDDSAASENSVLARPAWLIFYRSPQTMSPTRHITYVLMTAAFCVTTSAGVFDEPLTITEPDDAIHRWVQLKEKLSPQESMDLDHALHAIRVELSESCAPDLTKDERDRLLVLLIDKRTPREIILIASCLMRARYGESLSCRKFTEEERGDKQFLTHQVSTAHNFTKEYLNPKNGGEQATTGNAGKESLPAAEPETRRP